MLTGLLPATTGVRDEDSVLSPSVFTLAEAMSQAGYDTAAFTPGAWISPDFGLDQGFETFAVQKNPMGDDPDSRRAAKNLKERLDRVLAWIEAHRDRRWFVFLHSYQVHDPYLFREGFTDPAAFPGMADAPFESQTLPRDLWRAAYDGEVAYMDRHLGAFLDQLRGRGFDRNTLIVFTSDHGEEFAEHGEYRHGGSLYDEATRVVLILRLPTQVPAGKRVADLVSLVDIAPTILALTGTSARSGDGVNLVPLLEGIPMPPRLVYFEAHGKAGVRGLDDLLVRHLENGRREFYDLAADPGARRDISGIAHTEAAWFDANLSRYLEQGAHAPTTINLSAETKARLRAMGYLR
jgi:arylsulfatase A-like enzyme